ncbi:hypothetical protein CSC02_1231 [Enterobacter hormaechei subsp. hoffmannii]|nr:hypothetical protein CSC02_1231 [Enterobacter hormaechei subsp. hoffmannii]
MAFNTRRCLRHFSQPVLSKGPDSITFCDMWKKQAFHKKN